MSTPPDVIDEHAIDELVRRLAPIRDDELPAAATTPAAAELVEAILSQPDVTDGRRVHARRPRARVTRLRLAACLGVSALLAAAILGPALRGDGTVASAVVFSQSGDEIIADVTDPFADEERLNAAFAQRGLDIKLRLIPVSPAMVGTLIARETERPGDADVGVLSEIADDPSDPSTTRVAPVLDKATCTPGGCPIGLVIPANYAGSATFTIGRPARDGERYAAATSAFAPGEALHCSDLLGVSVGEAARRLADGAKPPGLTVSWRRAPEGMESVPRHDRITPTTHPPSATQIEDLLRDTAELDPDLVRDQPVTGATSVERGAVIMWVGTGAASGPDPVMKALDRC
jgi:hypothetical protein